MAKKIKPIVEQLRQAIEDAQKAGISRYRLAQLTGMSNSQIRSIAEGITVPKLDTAEKILAQINCSFVIEKNT